MHASRVIAVLGALVLLVAVVPASAQTPVATVAVRPFTSYRMNLTFDPAARTLAGSEEIGWVNTTGVPQAEVYLRLYPKAGYYLGGGLTIGNLTVNGAAATASSGDDPTVAHIALPAPVPAGGKAAIGLTFRTSIPVDGTGSFDILRLDSRTGIWALADWYPIVAGYDPGRGWYLAPPLSSFGDPTFSDASRYDVSLTMPTDLAAIGTGSETGKPVAAGNGLVTYRFTTGAPAREFALAIGPSGHVVTRVVDGVTLRVATLGKPFVMTPKPALVDQLDAFTLDVAAAAFSAYTRWFGPYGERDLDITYLTVEQALGVSWSGMTWISRPRVLDDGQLSEDERVPLAFTIAHEIGHQWLAGIIGSNNNDYGFISESLDNSLTPAALAGAPLTATANEVWRDQIGGPYLQALQSGNDGIVDRPVAANAEDANRATLIYSKGPLGFEAICQRIGPDAYFAGLRAYGQRFWYGISTPAELRQALEMAAAENGVSPADVEALWEQWFERADTTTAAVDAALRHAGSCVPAT